MTINIEYETDQELGIDYDSAFEKVEENVIPP